MWESAGCATRWPAIDPNLTVDDLRTMDAQVAGKLQSGSAHRTALPRLFGVLALVAGRRSGSTVLPHTSLHDARVRSAFAMALGATRPSVVGMVIARWWVFQIGIGPAPWDSMRVTCWPFHGEPAVRRGSIRCKTATGRRHCDPGLHALWLRASFQARRGCLYRTNEGSSHRIRMQQGDKDTRHAYIHSGLTLRATATYPRSGLRRHGDHHAGSRQSARTRLSSPFSIRCCCACCRSRTPKSWCASNGKGGFLRFGKQVFGGDTGQTTSRIRCNKDLRDRKHRLFKASSAAVSWRCWSVMA